MEAQKYSLSAEGLALKIDEDRRIK